MLNYLVRSISECFGFVAVEFKKEQQIRSILTEQGWTFNSFASDPHTACMPLLTEVTSPEGEVYSSDSDELRNCPQYQQACAAAERSLTP